MGSMAKLGVSPEPVGSASVDETIWGKKLNIYGSFLFLNSHLFLFYLKEAERQTEQSVIVPVPRCPQ